MPARRPSGAERDAIFADFLDRLVRAFHEARVRSEGGALGPVTIGPDVARLLG